MLDQDGCAKTEEVRQKILPNVTVEFDFTRNKEWMDESVARLLYYGKALLAEPLARSVLQYDSFPYYPETLETSVTISAWIAITMKTRESLRLVRISVVYYLFYS